MGPEDECATEDEGGGPTGGEEAVRVVSPEVHGAEDAGSYAEVRGKE